MLLVRNYIEVGDQRLESWILETLMRSAAPMHPRYLWGVSREYALFQPADWTDLVWLKPETQIKFSLLARKCQRLIVSLSGLPAGGKDTIRSWIDKNRPGLTAKIVTATTRAPREGAVHGVDNYYLSMEEYLALKDGGQLIGHSQQPTGLYGMPVSSIHAALAESRIAISDMEISGWPDLRSKVESELQPDPPPIISLFVLPQLPFENYVSTWLPQFRPGIVREKTLKAAWELSQAGKEADAIIINPIIEGREPADLAATAVADLLTSFLR